MSTPIILLIHCPLECNSSGVTVYNLSRRIGKVVALHAAVARSIPAEVATIYTMREALRGYCP